MFPLLETAIGFVAVMLILSLLVKSLTSILKDHFDFYCDNLRYEVSRLIRNTTGKVLADIETDPELLAKAPWIADVEWSRIGDEFFNKENVTWILKALGATDAQLVNLDGRITGHLSRVKYMFEQRMKNLSCAVGLGLCLVLDINALTIWKTLYTHDQLRTTFASDVATKALIQSDEATKGAANSESLGSAAGEFRNRLLEFTRTVSFGIGRIWRDNLGKRNLLYEFIGAVLTGLIVSVGAPYWHDVLENLSSLRRTPSS